MALAGTAGALECGSLLLHSKNDGLGRLWLSTLDSRLEAIPSPGPPPDEVHRDGGPPSPPRGRGQELASF
jgi:hypothetical protein